jgi:hypothetical protein
MEVAGYEASPLGAWELVEGPWMILGDDLHHLAGEGGLRLCQLPGVQYFEI